MDVYALLDTIEDIVERSFTFPIVGKTLVERDDILDIIKEIKLKLPDEMKQAKWVKEERHRILMDAQKEADEIIKDAESRICDMVEEHEITRMAMQKADEIVQEAHKAAKEVHIGSREYADDVLEKLEDILKDALETIKANRQELK